MVAGKLYWIHKSRTSVICYEHHGEHSLWETQCFRQWGTTILLWEISSSGIHILLHSCVMINQVSRYEFGVCCLYQVLFYTFYSNKNTIRHLSNYIFLSPSGTLIFSLYFKAIQHVVSWCPRILCRLAEW
jgi:hypothetical protein